MGKTEAFIGGPMGVINSLADNIDDFNSALQRGDNGTSEFTDDIKEQLGFKNKHIDLYVINRVKQDLVKGLVDLGYQEKEVKRLDRFSQLSMLASEQSISGLGPLYNPDDVGVIIGTSMGGIQSIEDAILTGSQQPLKNAYPFSGVTQGMANAPAYEIAKRMKSTGPSKAVSAACASGLFALLDAARYVENGDLKGVLVVTADAPITESPAGCFGRLSRFGVISNSKEIDTLRPCSINRKGFVLSEGASSFWVGNENFFKQHHTPILAKVKSSQELTTIEGTNSTVPSMLTLYKAITKTLKKGKVAPHEIDLINAHLTGTQTGDLIEMQAIAGIFENGHKPYITATKSMLGHSLGNSNGAEIIATMLMMQHGYVHPTINTTTIDPQIEKLGQQLALEKIEKPIHHALKTGWAFGGQTAAVLFQKHN